MTSNMCGFDISLILVPYTKIFTCNRVLLCEVMYAYLKNHPCFEKAPPNNCLYFIFIK